MKRFLVVSGFIALGAILTVISFLGRSHRPSDENQVRDREQTATQDPRYSFNRGRIGSEARADIAPTTWTGVLVDAGCVNRDAFSSGAPSAPVIATDPAGRDTAGQAKGITVSSQTLSNERADALQQQVPDLVARSADSACAVTGSTRAFALYTSNGELRNLDEGGNTLAMDAFQASPQGQAVLNGRSTGEKLRVAVKGVPEADRIVVREIRRM